MKKYLCKLATPNSILDITTNMSPHILQPQSSNTSYYIPPLKPQLSQEVVQKGPNKLLKSRVIKPHSPHLGNCSLSKKRVKVVSTTTTNSFPDPTYFAPLHDMYPFHNAENIFPSSLLHSGITEIEPHHVLELFLYPQIVETLGVNTNIYAAEKQARDRAKEREKGVRGWKPVDIRELQSWIGIIIFLRIVNILAVKDYWRSGRYPEHGWTPYLSAT